MHRMSFVLAMVFVALSVVPSRTQETAPTPSSIPAAVRFQADCSGFIAGTALPRDLVVTGGEDNAFHSPVRQFVEGDTIYVAHRGSTDVIAPGDYSVIRPANELFITMHYPGERRAIGKVGKPYENVGSVAVVPVDPPRVGEMTSSTGDVTLKHSKSGRVEAQVTFSCGGIVPGDILVPFQPKAIPGYTASSRLDPFAPLDSKKLHGRITASHNNFGFLGAETMIYLSLGEGQGAKPGQRFRIFKSLPPHATGELTELPVPPEIIGEAVVVSVQPKSSTAMVVSSYREISAGDFVEAE